MRTDPYRNSASLYDYVVGPLNIILRRARTRLAPPIAGMRVLDVGCGTGADLQRYSQAGCDVYGADLSPAMLEVAQKKLGDSAELRLCDAAQMSFPENFFDLVLSTFTLHEMPWEKRPSAVREITRVVKRDGRLLLTDFHPGPYRFPDGWSGRALILLLELMAGREHFDNGRDFLRRGGLQGLIGPCSLETERTAMVGRGNIAFLLLSTS